MDRESAVDLLRRLHTAQNDFYRGGDAAPLREVLTADIAWHVPGDNAIAGDHIGLDAVLGYFRARRALADRTFRMHPRGVLTGDGEWIISLTDGSAVIDGREHTWSTAGLYRVRDGRIAACRLLPFDASAFDAIWARREADSTTGPSPGPEPASEQTSALGPEQAPAGFSAPVTAPENVPATAPGTGPVTVSRQRVRPRHCDAQGIMHAARYYEYFEDAFLDWLDAHVGGYAALREQGADMVVVASGCEHRSGPRLDDRISIEVRPLSAGRTSLSMAFTVRRDDRTLAAGTTTYVAVSQGGATPLPAVLRAVLGGIPASRR